MEKNTIDNRFECSEENLNNLKKTIKDFENNPEKQKHKTLEILYEINKELLLSVENKSISPRLLILQSNLYSHCLSIGIE